MATARTLTGLAAVPIGQIKPSPSNPRERLTDIDELAVSIRENGLIQPLVVQRIEGVADQYVIVAGHRRHAAVKRLSWTEVPCIIRRPMLPDEELLAMLVENGQRAGLDPIEEARALRRLKSGGLTDAEIARKVGRSQSHVSLRLSLLALPTDAQEEVRGGSMTIREASDRGRIEGGTVRPGAKGKKGAAHLAAAHPLAARAKARCVHLKHKRGPGSSVGGIACGKCWEHVIRADERQALHDQSNNRGRCVLCDTDHDHGRTKDLAGDPT